jgi:hypothetical protein
MQVFYKIIFSYILADKKLTWKVDKIFDTICSNILINALLWVYEIHDKS